MPINRDLVAVRERAQKAVHLMGNHQVPPTPHNYLIWYDFVAGWNPDLSKDIEQMIAEGAPFTSGSIEEIYNRHYSPFQEERAIAAAGNVLENAIKDVSENVTQTMYRHSGSNTRLEDLARHLAHFDKNALTDSIGQVVRDIMEETQQITRENAHLNNKLAESANELEEMRTELDHVRREGRTDTLTGLANRRMFDMELIRTTAESVDTDTPLSLILCDVDHFKRFNDTFGHRVGDEVLRLLAKVLMDQTKGRDLAARYGGEEFAIILPQTPLNGACAVAEQVRKTLASKELVNRATGESFGSVTISLGIALFRPGESLEDLVQRADEALYRAKHAGRDRWAMEEPPTAQEAAERSARS